MLRLSCGRSVLWTRERERGRTHLRRGVPDVEPGLDGGGRVLLLLLLLLLLVLGEEERGACGRRRRCSSLVVVEEAGQGGAPPLHQPGQHPLHSNVLARYDNMMTGVVRERRGGREARPVTTPHTPVCCVSCVYVAEQGRTGSVG